MGPLYNEMVKNNLNDSDLGKEVRLLNQAFGENSCPTLITVLCERYPNDFELGEKFREFHITLNKKLTTPEYKFNKTMKQTNQKFDKNAL